MLSTTKKKYKVKQLSFATLLSLISAIVLPQIAHLIGIASGVGATLGELLLPMHLPILLSGFLAGPIVGGIAGILAPLISFAITGMPSSSLLPFMTLEICSYGLSAGALKSKNIPVFFKVLIAQIAGRTIRAAFIIVSKAFSLSAISPSIIFSSIQKGLLGIILQIILIPLICHRILGDTKYND